MRNLTLKKIDRFFKEKGFKKKGVIWYLPCKEIYILCQYQGSKIFNGFYLNFGLYFKNLLYHADDYIPIMDDCTFEGRYNQLLKGFVVNPPPYIDFEHFSEENILNKLNEITNNIEIFILPYLYQMTNYDYFEKNFPANFDHNRLWLQYIREKDFMDFIFNENNNKS